MIKIPYEICKECGKCCHGIPGEYVFARTHEDKSPQISDKGKCQFLNTKNKCKLGCKKPYECAIFPIRIFADGVYINTDCPGYKIALEQWNLTHNVSEKDWNKNKNVNYMKVSI